VTDAGSKRRILWALNHRTLMPDEVGLLRDLGFAVFTPRILPRGTEGRSTVVETITHGADLAIPRETLAVLEAHPFYDRRWPPTLAAIINEYFDTVVTAFYRDPFISAVKHFHGRVVARAFGREGVGTYKKLIEAWNEPGLEEAIVSLGERYVFGQAYPMLSEVEATPNASRAVTLPLPPPGWVLPAAGCWTGSGRGLLFLAPLINGAAYHRANYDTIKRNFSDLPHTIFGHQSGPVTDPAVLSSPGDAALLALYCSAAAFVYPSTEARHVHYSPIEAMIVGAPVLYHRGALLDRLAGEGLPGACQGLEDMHSKAAALAAGDATLSDAIREAQKAIIGTFSREAAGKAWKSLLDVGVIS
jgi:hypothetical protein